MDEAYFKQKEEQAYEIYTAEQAVHSPFFGTDIMLTLEGFRHLRYSAKGQRNKNEQVTRFTLLPLGLRILKTATTLQEYRKRLCPIGATLKPTGTVAMNVFQWWGFVAVFVKQDIKIRVVVRKVGDGNLHFWSVMAHGTPKRITRWGRIDGIEDG